MKQELEKRPQRSASKWLTTRTLVVAFAIVEALAIGAALLYGR